MTVTVQRTTGRDDVQALRQDDSASDVAQQALRRLANPRRTRR
jgi:hypothetical protein